MTMEARIGFAGLGLMGEPMALNLARSGARLTVWNRTSGKCEAVRAAGAAVAADEDELFDEADVAILMLADEQALDEVLGRGGDRFAARVAGRTIVHMGTTRPAHSSALSEEISAAGGNYVEAPVSGSRVPAERGELVAMIAGNGEGVASVRPLLAPMCRQTFLCGEVPGALMTKLAVNLFLITMVTGLAEAVHLAERQGLDLERFAELLSATPMASAVSRVKADKLARGDFSVQASILDVLKNARLVSDEARRTGAASPLLDQCVTLYGKAADRELGGADMAAVIEALRAA